MTVYSLVTKRGCGSHQSVRWSADQQGLVIASLQYWGACWWGTPADPQWLRRTGILGAAGSGGLGVGIWAGLDLLRSFRDTGSRLVIEFISLFYSPGCLFNKTRRKCFWRGVQLIPGAVASSVRHRGSHPDGSQWTAATLAGGWLSRLGLTGRAPATHTAVSPARHLQPGAAAAALSWRSSRRGASVWSPLLSGWETAAGRAGMSSRRRPPSSAALTSSRCGERGPLAPPAGPVSLAGPGRAIGRDCRVASALSP